MYIDRERDAHLISNKPAFQIILLEFDLCSLAFLDSYCFVKYTEHPKGCSKLTARKT